MNTAFNEAGFKNEAIKVLEDLTYNAVIESRFGDASYYYWLLSTEHLQIASGILKLNIILSKNNYNNFFEFKDEPNDSIREKYLKKFEQFQRMAEIYYAYQQVHRFVVEPFTEHLPDTLFNASRFLLHSIMKEPQIPTGISKL